MCIAYVAVVPHAVTIRFKFQLHISTLIFAPQVDDSDYTGADNVVLIDRYSTTSAIISEALAVHRLLAAVWALQHMWILPAKLAKSRIKHAAAQPEHPEPRHHFPG